MVYQRTGGPLDTKLGGLNAASGLDGWGYDNIFGAPSNAGPLPGVKMMMLGQQCRIPRPVTTGGALQAAPSTALTAVPSGTGSVYAAGVYSIAYSVVYAGTVTVPTQETELSPTVDVLLTQGQGIDIGACIALPGGAVGFRVYFSYTPSVRPFTQSGYVASSTTQAGINALVLTTAGDGVFGPQKHMSFGSIMMPPLTAGAQVVVTVADARVSANSVIFVVPRFAAGTPATTKQPVCYLATITPGTGFTVSCLNTGSVATVNADFCFDYWIIN